jgi:hypothetical protein
MKIGTVLFMVLDEYGSWKKQPTINTRINYQEAIGFIDQDLEFLVHKGAKTPFK